MEASRIRRKASTSSGLFRGNILFHAEESLRQHGGRFGRLPLLTRRHLRRYLPRAPLPQIGTNLKSGITIPMKYHKHKR